jgi:hypothetical protein
VYSSVGGGDVQRNTRARGVALGLILSGIVSVARRDRSNNKFNALLNFVFSFEIFLF